MRYLLYCIFRRGMTVPPAECSEVEIIEEGMLAAATSPWQDPPGAGLDNLKAYARTVAAFHASRTIIPLRYGCVLNSRSQVADWLQQHQADYQRLLEELEGTVEMGLRLLWAPGREGAPHGASGRRYLDLARLRQMGLTAEEVSWTDRLLDQLDGLYVREKREARAAPGGRLVSLYLLVPGGEVGHFRERVRGLTVAPDVKLLGSGPWPPYNFTDHAGK